MSRFHPASRHHFNHHYHYHRDYSPIHWSEYFDEAQDIEIESSSFRVYLKNFCEPYAPNPSDRRLDNEQDHDRSQHERYSRVPSLVLLHGGGYSALTWAEFTKHIESHCKCRVLAIDIRSHGDTKTINESKQMDIETLITDVNSVIHATHRLCGFPQTPKIVLIGHSMGGAIAIKCATKCVDNLPSLVGFVVIDVVEGTAKEALPQMISVIKTRPSSFPSLENAIEWCVRSGMAKSNLAARVSMPGNLINLETRQLAVHDIETPTSTENNNHNSKEFANQLKRHAFELPTTTSSRTSSSTTMLSRHHLPKALSPRVAVLKGSMPPPMLPPSGREITPPAATMLGASCDTIGEEGAPQEPEGDKSSEGNAKGGKQQQQQQQAIQVGKYSWRTNLVSTEPFWNGWFDGLSSELLAAPVQGKFLLLAGIDRLDKVLTIGQMQGKFMMKVLPKCGHAVHEDVPEQVAQVIGDFLVRNKFTTTTTPDVISDSGGA